MNLRENKNSERTLRTDRPATPLRLVGSAGNRWLTYYPLFQDALQHGETTFRMLPQQAKYEAVSRTISEAAEQVIKSAILDDVRVSYVELSTRCVVEVAAHFLAASTVNANPHMNGPIGSLSELALQIPSAHHPLIARPPCVLRPGVGIFLNGWLRFLNYWARGDQSIPLLAVDWPNFYDRLESACS